MSSFPIPKIIMQTWKTHDPPPKWQPSVDSINKYMPKWKHVIMSDDDNLAFVEKHFPDFLSTFIGFKYPIQRADAIRYMWLYVNGGAYWDLDLELNKSIESIFELNEFETCSDDNGYLNAGLYLIESPNTKTYLTNNFLASKPRHPFWLEMIEGMKDSLPWYAYGKHLNVILSTGPGLLNRIISRGKWSYVRLSRTNINPYSICDSKYNKDTYFIPLEGQSWVSWDTKLYGSCYCHSNEYITLGIIIAIIVIFLLFLTFRKRKTYNKKYNEN